MIVFDQETRQFSVVEDQVNFSNRSERSDRYERKYHKLIGEGMTHDGAIRKLRESMHKKHNIGQGLNVADSIVGLSNYNKAKKISKSGANIGVGVNLALHGSAGHYIEKRRKKGNDIIDNIDNKYKK